MLRPRFATITITITIAVRLVRAAGGNLGRCRHLDRGSYCALDEMPARNCPTDLVDFEPRL